MPLPNTAPIKTPGPAGFLQWLQRESGPGGKLPGVYQHVRSWAPHLITQAALHGLGDDTTPALPFAVDTTGQSSIDAAAATTPTFTVNYGSPTASADPTLPGGQSGGWASSLAQLVTPLVTGAEQIKLFNTQLSLAQQGRPPLNTSQIRIPGVGVNLGLQTNTGLLLGGIAAALGLAWLFGGRRRR